MAMIKSIEINNGPSGPLKCKIMPYINRVHRKSVMDIMNFYIENTYTDFCDEKFDTKMFDQLITNIGDKPFYVVEVESNGHGKVIGFGYLHTHGKFRSFSQSADFGVSIKEEFTRKGIGKEILDILVAEAKKQGIKTIMAVITSENLESVRFHEKNGFVYCGTFKQTCNKNGKELDEIWMQRFI